jgi:carbon monoxide dehydrogenase subunit G
MIDFTNTISIERPISDVFSYLSDLEHIPEWNWAIAETTKITPGPTTVGTRYRQTRATPRPATEMLEITELDPHGRIEVRGVLADMPAHLTYVLEEQGSGTVLTNAVSLDAEGPVRLLAPLFSRRISQAVASNLNDLKARLEARHVDQQERENRS